MSPPRFIRQVAAHESETVEIRWTCRDGSFFHQRVTIPPTATRAAVATPPESPDELASAEDP